MAGKTSIRTAQVAFADMGTAMAPGVDLLYTKKEFSPDLSFKTVNSRLVAFRGLHAQLGEAMSRGQDELVLRLVNSMISMSGLLFGPDLAQRLGADLLRIGRHYA
jgi:hypothetical protein